MNKHIFTFFTLLVNTFLLQAQNLNEAHKLFERFAYADAIPIYENYLNNHDEQLAMERLAECYRLTNKSDKAEKWLSKIVKSGNSEPLFTLYYAQTLQANNKCDLAILFAQQYTRQIPDDSRGKAIIEACNNLNGFSANAIEYEVKNAPLNSINDDFCPVYYNNGIVFCSDRESKKKVHDWTNKPFLDIYYAYKQSAESYSIPVLLNGDFKSHYHVGPVCFNTEGTVAYITRNADVKNNTQISRLKIFRADMIDGKWKDLKVLPFDNENYSIMHPFLSYDNQWLYFASDMPGGYGGIDLYRVMVENDNTYGEVENLGKNINTEGNEMFPHISVDGYLFFSSNGLAGIGGLDLFRSKISGTNFEKPQNLGFPINSNDDDFALVSNKNSNEGYFSSNRVGGEGGDDIYTFNRTSILLKGIVKDSKTNQPISECDILVTQNRDMQPTFKTDKDGKFNMALNTNTTYKFQASKEGYIVNFENLKIGNKAEKLYQIEIPLVAKEKEIVISAPVYKVEGTLRDKNSSQPLANADIKLTNKCNGNETVIKTTDIGFYSFSLDPNCDFVLTAQKEFYFTNTVNTSTKGYTSSLTMRKDIEIEKFEIGKAIKVENIYYDLGKWDIRPDAAIELDKLVRTMQNNPGIKIELGSHTDSRASDEFNLKLSSKRAASAVDYICSRGINKERLRAVGYGENQLINQCANGITCTEYEHQENRRTEFKVTEYDYSAQSSIFVTTHNKSTTNDTKIENSPSIDNNTVTINNTNTSTNTSSYNNTIAKGEVFKIQTKIVKEYNSKDFAAIQDLGTLENENTGSGFQRVLIGDFATLNDAKIILKYIKERGYPDAYIVSYINGKRGRIY